MERDFEESILRAIRNYAAKFTSVRAAASELGIKYETFRSWHNGVKSPTIENLSPIADKIGLQLAISPDVARSNTSIIQAKIVEVEPSSKPPQEKDYWPTPIVGEVEAGPGIVPENELKGWFMVHRNVISGRGLHNLIAVEISPHSVSMRPTLNPGDIVLVDKDDADVSRDGNIMLVLDPLDQSGMVKRVSVREQKGDALITYYSDNASQFPPMVYSLMRDFGGEWHNAIVGKVIWAWTDMKGK